MESVFIVIKLYSPLLKMQQ